MNELLDQLRHPIPDKPTLFALLAPPLAALSLLPPQFYTFDSNSQSQKTQKNELEIEKHISQIQRLLLTHVVPVWDAELAPSDERVILTQYFVPDLFLNARREAGVIARCAYATFLSSSSSFSSGTTSTSTSTGTTTPFVHPFALHCVSRLTLEYPIDRVYRSIFLDPGKDSNETRSTVAEVQWEDYIKDLCALPLLVANALGGRDGKPPSAIPDELENRNYFENLTRRVVYLLQQISSTSTTTTPNSKVLQRLTYLFSKLVSTGLFPPSPPIFRSSPSFFATALPLVRSIISTHTNTSTDADAQNLKKLWQALFRALPERTLHTILSSLYGTLPPLEPALDVSEAMRKKVKHEARLLEVLVGDLRPGETMVGTKVQKGKGKVDEKEEDGDEGALWDASCSLILSREWPESHARVFACWIALGDGNGGNGKATEAFLEVVLELWTNPTYIAHSLLSKHRYTTLLLLSTLAHLPPTSPTPASLISNSAFLTGVGAYIGHLDPAVRRCGMLVAEEVARRAGKRLDFGDWEGEAEGKGWCRSVRMVTQAKDAEVDDADGDEDDDGGDGEQKEKDQAGMAVDSDDDVTKPPAKDTPASGAAGYDSDDSLTGYASPTSASSRSPSPTPAELAEIEADPTLNVGRKKVQRPVYLVQLAELLRGSAPNPSASGGGSGGGGGRVADDPHEADRIDMGLACAEGLIRRKRGWGTELEENAVNLTWILLAMNDNYELEGFEERRQGALNALVVGAPTKAAPTLIQEFFKNQYSVEQRFVALNALALGARELAGLPIPSSSSNTNPNKTAFPSKTLPAPLHRKYLAAAGKADVDLVPQLMDDITKLTLDKQRDDTAEEPAVVRERRFRVARPRAGVTEIAPTTITTTGVGSLNPYASSSYLHTNNTPTKPPPPSFLSIAAEHFILPLTHHFWSFLRDEQAREERTSQLAGRGRYAGAGTGLVLSPIVLAQYLRTLGVLVSAARNAVEWLSVIAPSVLEVALAVGTRRVAHGDEDEVGAGATAEEEQQRKGAEASVLTAALEVALVILDGALELDGGRSLGLEHTALVLGTGEWSGAVFAGLEKGLRVQGGGGALEARLSRAAAGVAIKVDELMGRWGRSMLDTR